MKIHCYCFWLLFRGTRLALSDATVWHLHMRCSVSFLSEPRHGSGSNWDFFVVRMYILYVKWKLDSFPWRHPEVRPRNKSAPPGSQLSSDMKWYVIWNVDLQGLKNMVNKRYLTFLKLCFLAYELPFLYISGNSPSEIFPQQHFIWHINYHFISDETCARDKEF